MNQTIARRALLGTIVGLGGIVPGVYADNEYVIEEIAVEQPDGPLSLSAVATEPAIEFDSPGEIELAVTNEADDPIGLENRGTFPFGLLTAQLVEGRFGFQLDNPAYDESDHIDASAGSSSVNTTSLTEQIDPDETISDVYMIDGAGVPESGRFDVYGSDAILRYRDPDSDETINERELVALEIESRRSTSL